MGPHLKPLIGHIRATHAIPEDDHQSKNNDELNRWRQQAAEAQRESEVEVPAEFRNTTSLTRLYHTLEEAIKSVELALNALVSGVRDGKITGSQLLELTDLDSTYDMLMRQKFEYLFNTLQLTLTARRLTAALRVIQALLLNQACGHDDGRLDNHPRCVDNLLSADERSENEPKLSELFRRGSKRNRS